MDSTEANRSCYLGSCNITLALLDDGRGFFFFAVLLGLDELIRKKFVSGVLVLFVSGILPYIVSRWFILVPIKFAYVHNLTFELPLELWYAGYLLPAFFLAACDHRITCSIYTYNEETL